MFKTQNRNKRLIILETIALIMCLTLSSYLPIAHPETSESFTLPATIQTYGNAWNGSIAFGLFQVNASDNNHAIESYLVVMNTDGQIQYLRQSPAQSSGQANYWAVKNIAPNTLMFQGEPTPGFGNDPLSATHFWNYVTNTTQDFPNVLSHHDIEYDPVNNTFLTLQPYLRQIGNNTYLFDKIEELSATGGILWTWDTYGHIPLSEADPFNLTANVNGETVIDFTHANALVWDYNDSVIYLNCRHTNTFYKINETTGNIIWACGQFGNFTLLDSQGNNVTSLWYHSHDLSQIGPNTFMMFDNDYDNLTNPNDAHSRLTEITLNETSMTAYINWSWESPTSYWSPYWGSAMVLPNGDIMGVFGTPSHEFQQNFPWTSNNTGAIIVEVNPQGQLVRTYTFPVGWGIYRVQEIVYPTQASSTPTTTNQPTPTPLTNSSVPQNITDTIFVVVAILAVIIAVAAYNRTKHRKGRKTTSSME